MKIAVIGTGIAGNVAAYQLAREHEITVFEADSRIGGHTHTVDVVHAGQHHAVDTGFIVFNGRTYPGFNALIDELEVAWQDSDMSFSVRHEGNGLEYNGSTLNSLFAQRRNLLRPSFYRMIRDILRFNREAPALLDSTGEQTIGEYLAAQRYSSEFIDHFIIPMGAAIWSARPAVMAAMPAQFFVRFFHNHGMLSVNDRPVWRVIRGGSREYVKKLTAGHAGRIRLNTPVDSVRRFPDHVEIRTPGAEPERFDQVFMACHADQALRMLADPDEHEQRVLGAFNYQSNAAVLHTDASLMPRQRRAWAAWNYHVPAAGQQRVAVTYNMNILQGLTAPVQFCVTLNYGDAIDPAKIIQRINYRHPVFTPAAVAAQAQHKQVNGARRSYYCGAYWRYGFHEDGVVSALAALRHFQDRSRHEQRDIRRAG
jgi:predicted NAD/FAD-binding protein